MITATELRSLLSYDAETGVFRWLVDKGGIKSGAVAGTTHHLGYRVIVIDGRSYLAHRLVWLYVHGVWPADELDHENRVKSDNRLVNLREANSQQNMANRGMHSNNTSGIKGVVWNNASGKWQAQIRANGRLRYLGLFSEKGCAAAAYKIAAEYYFGKFAGHMASAH
jgi:hypothetical protein